MKIYSTVQVAEMEKCGDSTARRWAQGNGLQKIGKDFVWTDEDLAKFRERDKPGRRWPKKLKPLKKKSRKNENKEPKNSKKPGKMGKNKKMVCPLTET
jgi:hypothetical protein